MTTAVFSAASGPLRPHALGKGVGRAYLYDRGGEQRLYEFPLDGMISLDWDRSLSQTGAAKLVMDATLCDCIWLGRVRAVRHELVIFRDATRVWEGPITRVAYSETTCTILAKDVSWWFSRRALKSRFMSGNVVDVAMELMKDALTYDDVNIRPWLLGDNRKGDTFVADYNAYDGYTMDALDDCVDTGLDWAVMGRRVFVWAAVNPIGQTNMLRAPQDISAQVTVFEDGESLATRIIATGGDTYGAAVLTNGVGLTPAVADQEPVVYNYATNPSLKIDARGFAPHTSRFFSVTRQTGSAWPTASGGSWGELSVIRPAAGSKAESDFNSYEITMTMVDQAMDCAAGQIVSAILTVRATGPDLTTMSLSFRGMLVDGTVDDRAFTEGPPVQMKANTDHLLFVQGVVPDDIVSCWVEVSRETSKVPWKSNSDGYLFDRFAMWNGRIESWFDGDSADTSAVVYEWLGSPSQSRSARFWNNTSPRANTNPRREVAWPEETQYAQRVSAYYGLVEQLLDSRSTTRSTLETDAKATLMRTTPAPLGIDIPQNAPMLPGAPVTINELMPGTIIPIQSRSTCRQVGAMPILETLKCSYSDQGEKITATLMTTQAWEIDPPDDPDTPMGTEPDDDTPETSIP